jgi:hypothetical protein
MCDKPALYALQVGWDKEAKRGITEGRCRGHKDEPCNAAEQIQAYYNAREAMRQAIADRFDAGYRVAERKSKRHRDSAKAF